MQLRVCLIGVAHPSNNPRLVREADTLHERGHDVFVVFPSYLSDVVERDHDLLARRQWTAVPVDVSRSLLGPMLRRERARLCSRFAGLLRRFVSSPEIAVRAYTRYFDELVRAASRIRADWYIAHAHGALPVAVAAARGRGRIGFDCEDLLTLSGTDPVDLVASIEETYAPLAHYISFPTSLMRERFSQRHKCRRAIVLRNVFPLDMLRDVPEPALRPTQDRLRVHWFSQTITTGRGIRAAIESAGAARSVVTLYLRGRCDASTARHIAEIAAASNANVEILPLIPHDDLLPSLSRFDVGLALETNQNENGAITFSNKIGSYLAAGLALVATDTPGVREVFAYEPKCGLLCRDGDSTSLTAALNVLAADRTRLTDAMQASWRAARNRYCWEIEKEEFLGAVEG